MLDEESDREVGPLEMAACLSVPCFVHVFCYSRSNLCIMIAKHVPMKSVEKSNFASLVAYLCDTQNKQERLGWVAVTHCQSATPDAAAREVLATQARNTRAKSDKTYHLIVSFRPGEQVEEAACRAIEERLCEGLGLGAHQRVSALHYDTDSVHLHVAINKIHPTKHTIHNPYYDHPKLGRLCTALEREYDLAPDNHCPHQRGAACRATDMERHSGLESLLGWIKRTCQAQILEAPSWSDLHRVLQRHGLALHPRGTGFIVMATNGTAVKASSIDPAFSRPRLESRLGIYAAPERNWITEPPANAYAKQPLPSGIDTTALYARYCEVQQHARAHRGAARAAAQAVKERQVATVIQRARLKRATIKLLTGPGIGRRLLIKRVNKTLHEQLGRISKQYYAQRDAIAHQYQSRTWADWLRAQALEGDRVALAALRARCSGPRLPGNTMTGPGRPAATPVPIACDSITKNGTVIYRFGSTAVRDDGIQFTVSRGATEAGLQAALCMAAERYGPVLRVAGTTEFKAQVVQAAVGAKLGIRFDDALLEHRRQTLLEQTFKQTGHRHRSENGYQARFVTGVPARNRAAGIEMASQLRRGSGRRRIKL